MTSRSCRASSSRSRPPCSLALPARRRRLRARRSARPHEGRLLMASRFAAPAQSARSPARRGEFLRSMPSKAKVGGAILAVFVLIAIIGPAIAPVRPLRDQRAASVALPPTCITCSAPPRRRRRPLAAARRDALRRSCSECSPRRSPPSCRSPSASRRASSAASPTRGCRSSMNVFLVLPALPLLIILLGFLPHSGRAADRDRALQRSAGRGARG